MCIAISLILELRDCTYLCYCELYLSGGSRLIVYRRSSIGGSSVLAPLGSNPSSASDTPTALLSINSLHGGGDLTDSPDYNLGKRTDLASGRIGDLR